MDTNLDEIQTELEGKWKLARSENFDEFLKGLGLNVLFRKMAGLAKPEVEFRVEDGVLKLISKVSFFNHVVEFHFGKEYPQSFEGLEMMCNTKWENKKLITEAKPVVEGKGKPQTFEREKIDGELVQTMTVGDVKCTRVFKKIGD